MDFVYVKDVVDAYIETMNQISRLKEYNNFNVGTGVGTRIKDVLRIIESCLGKNSNISFENLETDQVWCSNEKIKNELNWSPKTSLKKGIQNTINYYSMKTI